MIRSEMIMMKNMQIILMIFTSLSFSSQVMGINHGQCSKKQIEKAQQICENEVLSCSSPYLTGVSAYQRKSLKSAKPSDIRCRKSIEVLQKYNDGYFCYSCTNSFTSSENEVM